VIVALNFSLSYLALAFHLSFSHVQSIT